MGRFKSFNDNGKKSYFIFSAIVLIIFLITLTLFLEIPNYFPNYKYISLVYKSNLKNVEISPNLGINIANITINDFNNTLIAFTSNTSTTNISVINEIGKTIINQQGYIGVKLINGTYRIFLINTGQQTAYLTFDYGVFNYNLISSFYSSLALLKVIYEVIMAGSIILGLYSIIRGLAKGSRITRKLRLRKNN
ncbi:MAG: hypothetical protein QXY87_01915 [Saccharolobus sp.]|uniref:Uncharacterized protein n=2 Tax=Saccharolobus shibatae TaxID=2286 RepID=A0A8F5GYJ8_9CREN|nr:hypothetical protein [Saccharolobus shibatae]MCH4814329.1 hypothetical protein [Saccharolobus shibatae]QXJ27263.1 hypothetical protein J5U23_00125 [Saccharolobus shibatae B12]QXJ30550.1 hypothetical protein J5U21_00194 [Saccharolobus shibatae]QXJ33587.1 hypothetical protein J5U22_00127 [Saccharolobus shibatae]